MFNRMIHEPLVHFLLAGALIFAVYSAVEDEVVDSAASATIVMAASLRNAGGTSATDHPSTAQARSVAVEYSSAHATTWR